MHKNAIHSKEFRQIKSNTACDHRLNLIAYIVYLMGHGFKICLEAAILTP